MPGGRLPTGLSGQALEPLHGGLGERNLPADGFIPIGNGRTRTFRGGLPTSDSGRIIITPGPFSLDLDVDVSKIVSTDNTNNPLSIPPVGFVSGGGRQIMSLMAATVNNYNSIVLVNQIEIQRYSGAAENTLIIDGRRYIPTLVTPALGSSVSFLTSGTFTFLVRPDTNPYARFRFMLDPWSAAPVAIWVVLHGAANSALDLCSRLAGFNYQAADAAGFLYNGSLFAYSSNGDPFGGGGGTEEITDTGITAEGTQVLTCDVDMRVDGIATMLVDGIAVAEHTVIPNSNEPLRFTYGIYVDPAAIACRYNIGVTEIESG